MSPVASLLHGTAAVQGGIWEARGCGGAASQRLVSQQELAASAACPTHCTGCGGVMEMCVVRKHEALCRLAKEVGPQRVRSF